jgi:Lysozyme like domain
MVFSHSGNIKHDSRITIVINSRQASRINQSSTQIEQEYLGHDLRTFPGVITASDPSSNKRHELHVLHLLHLEHLHHISTTTPVPVVPAPSQSASSFAGSYSCNQLEALWDQEGGNPRTAFIAAEIAIAESDGNPDAISPTGDYGLWQINASHGLAVSTMLSPAGSAQAAIAISSDGTDWSAWTTYTSGAYIGRCG